MSLHFLKRPETNNGDTESGAQKNFGHNQRRVVVHDTVGYQYETHKANQLEHTLRYLAGSSSANDEWIELVGEQLVNERYQEKQMLMQQCAEGITSQETTIFRKYTLETKIVKELGDTHMSGERVRSR